MKKILLSMLVVALCASCATKKIEKYGYARVELEVPCSKEGFDDASISEEQELLLLSINKMLVVLH